MNPAVMKKLMGLKLHLFAEFPIHRNGMLFGVLPKHLKDDRDLLPTVKRDYKVTLVPAVQAGKRGFKAEDGRFFIYKLITGPVELGAFMAEIGAGDDVIATFLRSLN